MGDQHNQASGVSNAEIMAAGWISVVVIVEAVLLSMQFYTEQVLVAMLVTLALVPLTVLIARGRARGGGGLDGHVQELTRAMQTMTQEAGLSEGAKRVLHRRQERELLRRAIEQDISDQDWDAAMVLVKELAEEFGYRNDAEGFRTRIERARAQTQDQDVVQALAGLDELIRGARWAEAYAEAARVHRLFPESHRSDGLRERVDHSRMRYRKELERRFLEAAQGERIDDAMDLLKELDQYLSPDEAGPLQEVARGVIGKSRDNLGVRFKLMVQDHQWGGAVEVGEQIIREFPNTKMAEEVRGLVDVLRDRAARAG